MAKHSKRYAEAAVRVDRDLNYEPVEAFDLLKSLPAPKFDETVEVCVRLGVDPRKSDQLVRGAVSLPKGLGKTVTVVVFAEGDKAEAAKAAGADEVGSAELAAKIQGGWMDFDVAVASPDMMRVVSKLGRMLGPKGLMPSPKAGTVTPDVVTAVKEYSAGKLEYRNDDGGNIHCIIGKMSFPEEDLLANLEHFVGTIQKIKPAAAKGQYVKKLVVSGTMTPGIQIAL